MTSRRHARSGASAERRPAALRGLLLAVAVTVALLLVLLLQRQPAPERSSTVPPTGTAPGQTAPTPGQSRRDQIAAAPMLEVPPLNTQPRTAAAVAAARLEVPAPLLVGPAGVPSGFPRTPAGAVAQLAALESTVVTTMSLPATAAIHRAWALPGGTGPQAWEMTGHVKAFLGAAGMRDKLDATATVTALPAAGLVKGSDGPDWVLACVLLEVSATISVEARISYGHCERLQWQRETGRDQPERRSAPDPSARGRWMIAPGSPPAAAPSTWPGSELSRQAGWQTWSESAADGQRR